MRVSRSKYIVLGALLTLISASSVGEVRAIAPLAGVVRGPSVPALAHAPRLGRIFKNLDPAYRRASYDKRIYSLIVGGRTWLVPARRASALPSVAPDVEFLRENHREANVTWIGHSTLLVQLDGVNFLTDPTWANRSGPFNGAVGARRYTPPPVRLEDLPPIDFVLISHDHYDHLDEATVVRLARLYNPLFVVPLGIKGWLADRGVTRAVELDWGESVTFKGLTLVCTPAQHGSGRTPLDQGRRLWASWAVIGSQRFYFGGDSGYYQHYKEIGDALGPFDLAALPIGSYTPRDLARPVHMSPEDAVQAWLDLRAKRFIAIHWGTFMLAREPYDEPSRRLAAEIERRQLDPDEFFVPRPGDLVRW
ncbi:MAG TPA: MBL fold metallo-hydrolase [Candidatus Methylomirabilis sp.]|nr:MBL fold metallo-hydrolase [Candidatus Methylomirabilis sp.]